MLYLLLENWFAAIGMSSPFQSREEPTASATENSQAIVTTASKDMSLQSLVLSALDVSENSENFVGEIDIREPFSSLLFDLQHDDANSQVIQKSASSDSWENFYDTQSLCSLHTYYHLPVLSEAILLNTLCATALSIERMREDAVCQLEEDTGCASFQIIVEVVS